MTTVTRPFLTLSFQSSLSLLLIFILGCSINPSSDKGQRLSEEQTLLRVEASYDLEAFRKSPRVLQVIEAQGGKDGFVVLKDGEAPLPPPLQKLEENNGIERIEGPKGSSIGSGEVSDFPSPDPSSDIDLPDIFDIFTRVY